MAKPTLKFRLNGKAFSGKPETPSTIKIRAVLDALPDGDLVDCKLLSEKARITYSTIRSEIYRTALLNGYRVLIKSPNTTLYWGNPRTIAELKKHKELLA